MPATICASVGAKLQVSVTLFEKPIRQHGCKLLILRGGNCRSEGSEYICLLKAWLGNARPDDHEQKSIPKRIPVFSVITRAAGIRNARIPLSAGEGVLRIRRGPLVAGGIVEIRGHAGLGKRQLRSLPHSQSVSPPLISSLYSHPMRGIAFGKDTLLRNGGEGK